MLLLLLLWPLTRALQTREKVLVLPGGGLFFWWQLGAMSRIRQEPAFKDVKVVGTSAGALAALCGRGGVEFDEALKLAIKLADDGGVWTRGRLGLAGIWGDMIRVWLDELLPDDAADLCKDTNFVVLQRKRLWYRRQLATDFQSKKDLIDAALASAHVPFFLDGRLNANWRNTKCIDGSFRLLKTKRSNSLIRGTDLKELVFVDYSLDPQVQLKKEKVFKLPKDGDSHTIEAYLSSLGDRGYQWADTELRKGKANSDLGHLLLR